MQTLYILQLVVGCLMIVAFGVWLVFNYRWRDATGEVAPDKKPKLDRFLWVILIGLVLPNVILIFLTRGLS